MSGPVLESGARGHADDPQERGEYPGAGERDPVRGAAAAGGRAAGDAQGRAGDDTGDVESEVVPLGSGRT